MREELVFFFHIIIAGTLIAHNIRLTHITPSILIYTYALRYILSVLTFLLFIYQANSALPRRILVLLPQIKALRYLGRMEFLFSASQALNSIYLTSGAHTEIFVRGGGSNFRQILTSKKKKKKKKEKGRARGGFGSSAISSAFGW